MRTRAGRPERFAFKLLASIAIDHSRTLRYSLPTLAERIVNKETRKAFHSVK